MAPSRRIDGKRILFVVENNAQIFQMMADSFLRQLQMERVEVVVADHSYFQQNPGASICYQHPNIYVYPKWQERSNHVRMLNDMERVMVEAKLIRNKLVEEATPLLPPAPQRQEEPQLTRRQRILGKVEVHFLDEQDDEPIAILEVPAGTREVKIRLANFCYPFYSHKEGVIWVLPLDAANDPDYREQMGLSKQEIDKQVGSRYLDVPRYPEVVAGSVRCPNCSTQNESKSKYCDECGAKLPLPPTNKRGGGKGGYGNRY
jgi:hypothetical protein